MYVLKHACLLTVKYCTMGMKVAYRLGRRKRNPSKNEDYLGRRKRNPSKSEDYLYSAVARYHQLHGSSDYSILLNLSKVAVEVVHSFQDFFVVIEAFNDELSISV